MTEQSVDQIRGAVQAVLDRGKTDEAYAQALKADPVGTLTAAGVDPGAAKYVADQELNTDDAEVSGYMKCTWTCDRYTCLATICGNIPYSN